MQSFMSFDETDGRIKHMEDLYLHVYVHDKVIEFQRQLTAFGEKHQIQINTSGYGRTLTVNVFPVEQAKVQQVLQLCRQAGPVTFVRGFELQSHLHQKHLANLCIFNVNFADKGLDLPWYVKLVLVLLACLFVAVLSLSLARLLAEP